MCTEVYYLLPIHFWNKYSPTNFHPSHLIFELGDVTIVADDEQIKAHKYLLRFAATFFSIHL